MNSAVLTGESIKTSANACILTISLNGGAKETRAIDAIDGSANTQDLPIDGDVAGVKAGTIEWREWRISAGIRGS